MKTFARIVIGIIILSLIGMFIASCSPVPFSGAWHLKKSEEHERKAAAKGVKIAKDTVYKEIIREVPVPGDTSKKEVEAVLDTVDFFDSMAKNDSLVLAIDKIHKDIATGAILDKEKAMAALSKANKEIINLRWRIAQGFSKDSVYVSEPDSVTRIEVEVKDGLVKRIDYMRKPTTIKVEETIPIAIQEIFKMGYTYWQVLGALFLAIVFGFLIGYMAKRNLKT